MRTCAFLLLVALIIGGCGGLSAGQVTAHAARDMVMNAQRAGVERHDLGFYMDQWTDDAEMVLGRGSHTTRYDRNFTRGQIETVAEQRFHGSVPAGRKLKFTEVSVTPVGEEVHLEWTATLHESDGFEAVREVYKLRLQGGKWKVHHNRFWPLRTQIGTDQYEFGIIEWQRRDREVFDQRRKGDVRLLVVALIEAYRFREAHEIASKATEGKEASALLWVMRGIAAVQAGEVQDAYTAFRMAVGRDPRVGLPAYKAAYEAALTVRKPADAAPVVRAPAVKVPPKPPAAKAVPKPGEAKVELSIAPAGG